MADLRIDEGAAETDMEANMRWRRENVILAILAGALSMGTIFGATGSTEGRGSTDRLAALPPLVETAMEEWKVPGLAVGVVKDGEAIYMEGFGRRDIEKNLPVTPATLFRIASITKSFTSMAVALLVDEGKLDWDTPVIEYLPDFRLYDAYATLHTTTRDLLSHRTGLPGHYPMTFLWPDDRDEICRRLRYLDPSAGFREEYRYGNLTYITAGCLIERITGISWERFVTERILQPLAMTTSSVKEQIDDSADYALPYELQGARLAGVPYTHSAALNPAGGITSNVQDMVEWLKLHLNGGKVGREQFISPDLLQEIHTPQMPISYAPDNFLGQLQGYGLGWNIQPYRGHYLLHHGGWMTGATSWASFMPHENLGIIVLSNRQSMLPRLLHYVIYDQLLGFHDIQWEKFLAENKLSGTSPPPEAEIQAASAALPAEEYSGVYEHPAYGRASIEVSEGHLEANFNDRVKAPLRHLTYNTFELDHDGTTFRLGFGQNKLGQVERIEVPWESQVKDVVYVRMADESLRDVEFLSGFVGEYEYQDLVIQLELRADGALMLRLPGQPIRELVPITKTLFRIEGDEHTRIELRYAGDGGFIEAIVHLREGSFTARKR
jgi:CubicO group peptidase (beta-lactamase class C family)